MQFRYRGRMSPWQQRNEAMECMHAVAEEGNGAGSRVFGPGELAVVSEIVKHERGGTCDAAKRVHFSRASHGHFAWKLPC
jgi:hypothetical protein